MPLLFPDTKGSGYFANTKREIRSKSPGGHREPGESIAKTAKRELMEETGAYKFFIKPICVYSVTGKNKVNMSGKETFGMLFLADIFEFSESLTHEIELVKLFDELPENWTYPEIQPYLIREYQKREKSS